MSPNRVCISKQQSESKNATQKASKCCVLIDSLVIHTTYYSLYVHNYSFSQFYAQKKKKKRHSAHKSENMLLMHELHNFKLLNSKNTSTVYHSNTILNQSFVNLLTQIASLGTLWLGHRRRRKVRVRLEEA